MIMLAVDSGFLYVIIFWGVVFFINLYLKTSRRHGFYYGKFLVTYGVSLSFCQIRWQTAVFNKFFSKIGRSRPKLSLLWFNVGAVFAVIAMATSLVLLSTMLYQSVKETKPEKVLQPVMPGMNMPWNQVWYYLVTLIISGTFHEMGHAIAAVRENVRVLSFGVFMLFLYPGAFVELHTDQLEIITPLRRLRIYSAGVWHNFVLAVIAYLLSTSLPVLLTPFYIVNNGVLVTWISPQLSIASRLPSGDVIMALNNCPVKSTGDWYNCLQDIQLNPPEGYCRPLNIIKTQNTSLPRLIMNYGELDCCNDTSSYRFCFWYQLKTKPPSFVERLLSTNTLVRISSEYNSTFTEHACLPARQTISTDINCKLNQDCSSTRGRWHRNICLKPLVKRSTRVIRIKHQKGQDVLFVGDPAELSSTILLSNYVPKWSIPFLSIPDHLQSLLLYLISISSALAILNMVPSLYLDGHHTLGIILEILIPDHPQIRSKLKNGLLMFGTCLLVINVIIALSSLVTTSG